MNRGTRVAYGESTLASGIRSRFVDNGNGLTMHVLEAGFEPAGRPCIVLLHGFPELAYSWRKIIPALASNGFHVIAPDLRGYGRTTGWTAGYDDDLNPFRLLNHVRDILGLVHALGYRTTAGVAGHDFGASVAAYCALVRPDVFRSMMLMSAPFAGPPAIPFGTAGSPAKVPPSGNTQAFRDQLAALDRPRKHYHWYYSTRPANADMMQCAQGVHAFMRAYYHHKSADWKQNTPHKLDGWIATELAKMPTYYIMDLKENMAETVAHEMPTAQDIAACRWLPEEELRVYSSEYERNGFQGGLQNYRCRTTPGYSSELELFSGRTVDVPSAFISGRSDWGTWQAPGAFEAMQTKVCTTFLGAHLVDGAGHWVQQEQPEAVSGLLLDFLKKAGMA